MKKNIGFIPLDSSLAAWLLEKLTKEPPISDSAEELRSGIRDMLNGEVNSLLLSATGEAELPPLTPPDGIRIGELEINPKNRRVISAGREISLTPKEFDILYFLAQNKTVGRSSPRSKFTARYGRRTTCWMTATLWRSSASCAKRSSRIRTRRSTS